MIFRKNNTEIQVVNKRSSRLTIIVICVAVVLSILALLVLHAVTQDWEAQADAWRNEAQNQEQQKTRWEELLGNLGSLEGIKDIAESILGLTDPNTVIIQPEN